MRAENIELSPIETDHNALLAAPNRRIIGSSGATVSWVGDVALSIQMSVQGSVLGSEMVVLTVRKSGRDHTKSEYLAPDCGIPRPGVSQPIRGFAKTTDPLADSSESDSDSSAEKMLAMRRCDIGGDPRLACSRVGRLSELRGKKHRFRAEVTISREQRQYELLALWLLASGRRPNVSVAEVIWHLRLLSCGLSEECDVPAEFAAAHCELEEEDMRRAVVDLASVTPPPASAATEDVAVAAVLCDQLVALAASAFDRMHSGLAGLDAASFVRLLEDVRLAAKDEYTVFQAALKWCAGRLTEVLDRVLPLVRFPLVDLGALLIAGQQNDEQKDRSKQLKSLMSRSPVVKELVREALDLQMGKSALETFRPKRHAIHCHAEPVEVKRHQPRALCRGDKIKRFDLTEATLA